ncbi:16011_t:CDS:1 [Acaulospora colombiana]|uniref:16011_t:CDS:1 n=1 Tax=Acaulospora colombiana TaxID=27376 RepID=A0ACA9LXG5_9GLOM|nr:16011_t:CDS:1 [Acaulospora colombiana]
MMFDSFQPPFLPDDSSASSNTSTQLEVTSQYLALPNVDVETHKSSANDRRSSQTPNISMTDNEDQRPTLQEVNSFVTDTNSLMDRNVDERTGKYGPRSLKLTDTPATVISLLDSPTESGVNETSSMNDSHSSEYQRTADTAAAAVHTSSNAAVDIPMLTLTKTTIADTRPSASVNQGSSINPVAKETSGDLDLSMVVENPEDCEPTILGTLTPIRRKPLRVMRCEHEELAVLREVKKDNRNKGRKFFSCPRFETGEQCNYFRWEEAQYLPPRLPSHRSDYIPSSQRKSRDTNDDRMFATSRSQGKVSLAATAATEKLRLNQNETSQQQVTSMQKTNTSNNDNLLEVTEEDMDPSWFLNAIEEERARNASAKSKDAGNRGNSNNGDIRDGDDTARNATTLVDSSPTSNSQSSVRNIVAADSVPSSYESWSLVPKFSTQQLLDVLSSHLRAQERHNVTHEESMEKMRKERDHALDELKKAQEQIASLKRELERSSLMTSILTSQKRLLEIEKEQLEDCNKRNKSGL